MRFGMGDPMGVNREYKSTVFAKLFNDPDRLLALYNALSRSTLPADTPVEIATLEDVLFNERRNDVAFVLDGKVVVLVEHQSTISENMPLRLLLYVARVYEQLIDDKATYMKTLMKIPKPDFIVLYNGIEPFPDERMLRLSDAYESYPGASMGLGGSLELEVRMVNINEGRNSDIVRRCKDLEGYVRFVGKVRLYLGAGVRLKRAMTQAVRACIREGILADFLKKNASEVINMLTTEWDINVAMEVWKEEAREDGLEEGRAQGIAQGIEQGIAQGIEQGIVQGAEESLAIVGLSMQGKTAKQIARAKKIPIKRVEDILLKWKNLTEAAAT